MRGICSIAFGLVALASVGAAAQVPQNTTAPVAGATLNNSTDPTHCSQTTTPAAASCTYTAPGVNSAGTAAAANPGPTGGVTSSSNFDGVNVDHAFSGLSSYGYYYEYVTINQIVDPISNIYQVVLSSSSSLSVATDEPQNTIADASTYLEGGTIDGSDSPTDLDDSGTEIVMNKNDADPGSKSSTDPLTATLYTSDFITPDIFYFFLEATTTINDVSNQTAISAFASVDAPTITLEDANGNDITPQYGLTYDPPVTTTPEPASLGLVATGLLGLGGMAGGRRRRVRSQAAV